MKILLLVAAGMAVAEDTSSTLRSRNDSVRTGEARVKWPGYEWDETKRLWDGRPRHCKDYMNYGDCWSGLRYVYPYPAQPYHRIHVYCEQTLHGGGWTVIQKRADKPVREDFYRTWHEYRLGFGKLEDEFWLGLDNIHAMTSKTLQELRVDLYDWEGNYRWAKYGKFYVAPENSKYRLHIGKYTGNAGDSLDYHNRQSFSTHGHDNDNSTLNCAETRRGAWWYKDCCLSNLNGYPHKGYFMEIPTYEGITWHTWRGGRYSLKRTRMMIRPAF